MTATIPVGIHVRGWWGCLWMLALFALISVAGFLVGYMAGRC